jgi:serine/threonine-protein kinase
MEDGEGRCDRCGARLAGDGRFCGECGLAIAPESRSAPRRIGRFEVGRVIGHGGMGVVHRARDTVLGREVALKLIAPALAEDAEFRARFEAEARAAAAIDHPNVLPVFDAGEEDGELYLAMRLVEGTDLRAELTGGPLEAARVSRIVAQVGAALDAAHARNLVHRDVKPANVLISRAPGDEDHVYLTDFGLTRISGESLNLTDPGRIVGTANYMAPEQIEGGEIDGRVDVYALACVAFETLTGKPPFARETAPATLAAHLHDDIPAASERNGALPSAADDALAGGLAKSAAHRFASCGALARALGTALGTSAGEAPRDPNVAARARPARPAARLDPEPATAPLTPTAVREPPVRRRAGRALAALLALLAAGAIAGGAILMLPPVLGGDGGADRAPTLRLLREAQAVDGELSGMLSQLAADATSEALRQSQLRQVSQLRARVTGLLAAAPRAATSVRPLLLRSLRGQRQLLGQYTRVLSAPLTDAQAPIAAMLATLSRVEAELGAAGARPGSRQ